MSAAGYRSISLVLGMCVLAAGCSVLAPRPDRSRFYILTPASDGAAAPALAAAASPSAQLTLGVGPVSLPDYLRRLPVVTRIEPNRIEIAEEKRWAEPLDKSFTRVLCENLATMLGTERIERYPWPLATKLDYRIEVDVERFETTSDGQTQLVASWIIRDGRDGKILYASRTVASAPAGADATSASAALSADLATMCREIATQIGALERRRTPANSEASAASAP
ncbi:MAG TPA: PqiC family protein [Candidatus Binataceae bacterium]|nr:PqiC family protein [Candidatus Binataceae bacterium]